MVELTIKDYLAGCLDVPVYLEMPKSKPQRFVLMEKTGGGERSYIASATLAIQSYAESLYQAAVLNELVKGAMRGAAALTNISRCQLNSDYNYTDTTRKLYRYQAVYDLVALDLRGVNANG